jgi:hypothetical protein
MPAPAAALGAGRLAGGALANGRTLLWLALVVFGIPLAFIAVLAAMIGGLSATITAPGAGITYEPSAYARSDIPPVYLVTYQTAGGEYGLGWEYLAAIGKIESDHGRGSAAGIRTGVNFAGCCAGPMQFSITGAGGGTWGAYGVDGDDDARRDVYDPDDAIPGAANYLKASGAPAVWDRALFAYNHAAWYVADVTRLAERYRGQPVGIGGNPGGSGESQALAIGASWLLAVPGTGAVCDRRIVPDVELLLERYTMALGHCYAAGGPHSALGEHPLGLAIDVVPGRGGSWELLAEAARDFGWRESCGSTGCAGLLPAPFRFIGWNGYPGHGDPAHVGAKAHLHFSWQHTPTLPGTPAARVQTLLPGAAATPSRPETRDDARRDRP